MPWPALIGPALSIASSLIGKRKARAPRAAAPIALPSPVTTLATRAVGAVVGRVLPGAVTRRRRRRVGLTMREMEKIAMMAAVLGPRSPAVTMITMRALGGRI